MSGASNKENCDDIVLAHQYRIALTTAPSQSQFRVVAVVFLQSTTADTSTSSPSPVPFTCPLKNQQDGRQYVVGTNDEPGYIGGSICAERAALVQLRFLPNARVTKIVITTDSHGPISPGMLCREFMAGHSLVPWDVEILLGGSLCRCCGLDVSGSCSQGVCAQLAESCPGAQMRDDHHCFDTVSTTLRDLYPYPSCFSRLNALESLQKGKAFVGLSLDSMMLPDTATSLLDLSPEERRTHLLSMAQSAASGDDRRDLHPIQFGASVLYSDGRTETAYQKKALEYGSTLDAVTQLTARIVDQPSYPLLIVQSDQFGIAHAPFANARAFLMEHGYGSCMVLLHQFNGDRATLICIRVSELAPSAPDMGSLWTD